MGEPTPASAPSRRRLSRQEAERLFTCLEPLLVDRHIDKIWRPKETALLVRLSGADKRRLWIDVSPPWPHLTLTDTWPQTPDRPDQTTLRLRATVEGCRIVAAAIASSRVLTLTLARRQERLRLQVQLAGRYPNVSVATDASDDTWRLRTQYPAIDLASPPLREGQLPYADLVGDAWLERWCRDARDQTQQMAFNAARRDFESRLRAQRKRLRRRIQAIERDLVRADGAAGYLRDGESLKAALHTLGSQRGRDEVTVTDFFGEKPTPVTIALDPRRSPQEQMAHLFKQHRRLTGAKDAIMARFTASETRATHLDRVLADVAALTTDDLEAATSSLEELRSEAQSQGLTRVLQRPGKPRKTPAKATPYHRYTAKDGSEILVGKGAKHNDTLTFRVARGWDIWMHAKDAPGAHVVLRASKGQEAHPEALLDAAQLAADYSRLKGDGVVTILWARRKHVRKAAGSKAGEVYVSEGRSLTIRPEEDRRERLKASRSAPGE